MAEQKYINQAGLQKAFELIAGKYSTIADFNALVALVGAAAKGSEDAKSILDRVAALELLAGESSVAEQIAAAVKDEADRAKAAEEANAAAAKAAQDDVDALEGLVGTASDGKDAATVFGAIAKEADARANSEKAITDRLDVIEGEGEGSIKKAATDAVAKVVADAPEAYDTLAEIAAWIASEESAADAADLVTRVTTLEGADTVEGSVANSIKVMKEALDAEVTSTDGGDIVVKVTEVDGVITAVNVVNSFVALTDEEITAAFNPAPKA